MATPTPCRCPLSAGRSPADSGRTPAPHGGPHASVCPTPFAKGLLLGCTKYHRLEGRPDVKRLCILRNCSRDLTRLTGRRERARSCVSHDRSHPSWTHLGRAETPRGGVSGRLFVRTRRHPRTWCRHRKKTAPRARVHGRNALPGERRGRRAVGLSLAPPRRTPARGRRLGFDGVVAATHRKTCEGCLGHDCRATACVCGRVTAVPGTVLVDGYPCPPATRARSAQSPPGRRWGNAPPPVEVRVVEAARSLSYATFFSAATVAAGPRTAATSEGMSA